MKIVWSSASADGQTHQRQGYTSYRDRVFRLFYNEQTQILSIYPCDEEGAPTGLYVSNSRLTDIDVVLGQVIEDIDDHESVRNFLEWSLRVFRDMGVVSSTIGEMVNSIYSQLSSFIEEDEASLITSSIINDILNNNVAES